jgi:soluble lytic murein transglycosylase-like protein
MADSLAELEDALGIAPVATPLPTAIPNVTATSAPELSWFERMRQLAYASPTNIGGVSAEEYAKSWTPSGAVQNLRIIPEEGASIAGSVVGGTAGTFLGGPIGGILGGALGSYADVPIQMGIDYLTGTTPTESRIAQATGEAGLGAGIETGLRGFGYLGKKVVPLVRAGTNIYNRFVGPSTEEAAQRLVGSELVKSITREELVKAAVEKEALGTIGEALTTADVTGSKQLARMQELLSGQDLGQANITFAETAAKQLDDLDQAALSMSALKDPNPKRSGEAVKGLLEQARKTQMNAAGAKFTDDLREIVAPSEGIAKAADDVVESIYKGSDVLGPSGTTEGLLTKIRELEGEGKAATTTVGILQDLRSQALELSRSATRGSRDELLADRLSEMLSKRIDEVPGTEKLKEAQSAWRKGKQRWYRTEDGQLSPLAKLLRKQNPEDIITSVSKKSAVSDEYAKVLGSLEPNKLATEMADFVQQKTVDNKLKWLRSKRAVFVDSPIAPVLQQWEDALTKIQNTAEAADVKGLSARNIDTQATSLIRALGGTGKEAIASGAEAGALSAMRNVGRSGITSALGGKLAGVTAGVGERLLSGTIQESTAKTASALAQALTDPATALKYIDDAAKYGKEEAARIVLQDQRINEAMSLVESLAPRAAAVSRGAGLFTPAIESTQNNAAPIVSPTMTQSEAARFDALAELESALGDVAAEPTPQPEAVSRSKEKGKGIPTKEVSALLDEVPREYGINPRWVKAIAQVESSFNPKAVGPKTRFGQAQGLMQLMPATAKALKVENPFDPKQAIEGASKLLVELDNAYGKYKDKRLLFAAYNSRPSTVKAAISQAKAAGKDITWENIAEYMPIETQNYVKKVTKLIEA